MGNLAISSRRTFNRPNITPSVWYARFFIKTFHEKDLHILSDIMQPEELQNWPRTFSDAKFTRQD